MKRCFAIMVALACFLSFGVIAQADANFYFGDSSLSISLYTAASCDNLFLCCDMYNSQYLLYDGDSLQKSMSSVTLFESGTTRTYRSALCVVSSDTDFYSVETNITQNSSAGSFKFNSFELRKLNIDQNSSEVIAEIDVSPAIVKYDSSDYEACMRFINAAMSGDRLYIVFETPIESSASSGLTFAAEEEIEHFLLRYEVGNPTPKRFELAGGADLIAAQGDLVMYSAPVAGSNDVQICMLDTASANRAVLKTVSGKNARPEHFAYDIENAKLYYNISSTVYEMSADGASTLVAAFPFQDIQGLRLLSGNRIVAWSIDSVVARNIDPNAGKNISKLSVYQNKPDLAEAFSRENPLITVVEASSDVDLVDTVLTQSSTPDVMILNSVNDAALIDLLKRGYLLPLDSAVVADTVSKMYPEIGKFVTHDGNIVALPIEQIVQPMLGVNAALWEELELGALPQTWEDLFSLIQNWPEVLKKDKFVSLFASDCVGDDARRAVFELLLRDYEHYRQGESNSVGYDTEIFRNLLRMFQSIDFDAAFEPQLMSANKQLLTLYYEPSAADASGEMSPLPLRVSQDAPMYMTTGLTVVVINPYSAHIDAAKQFVDYCAQNIAPIYRIELMPDENAPIRDENYDRQLAYYQNLVSDAQTRLDACTEDVERQPLEEALQSAQQMLTACENSWLADEASIARYRSAAEHIYVQYIDSLDLTETVSVYQAAQRYLSGELPEDSFIGELERKYVMRTQEGAQ